MVSCIYLTFCVVDIRPPARLRSTWGTYKQDAKMVLVYSHKIDIARAALDHLRARSRLWRLGGRRSQFFPLCYLFKGLVEACWIPRKG
jgi:hypothetical protein